MNAPAILIFDGNASLWGLSPTAIVLSALALPALWLLFRLWRIRRNAPESGVVPATQVCSGVHRAVSASGRAPVHGTAHEGAQGSGVLRAVATATRSGTSGVLRAEGAQGSKIATPSGVPRAEGTRRSGSPGGRQDAFDAADQAFLRTAFEMFPSCLDLLFSAQSPLEVAEALARICQRLNPVAKVGVFLIRGEDVLLTASEGLKDVAPDLVVPIGKGQVGFAAKSLVPMDSGDFTLLSNLDRAAAMTPTPLPSFDLFCPIIRPRLGGPQGVVAVSGFSGTASWRARIFQLVCTIASFAIDLADRKLRDRDDVESDPLTGLPTRKEFEHACAQALEEGLQEPLSICILEVDHFQKLTDAHGEVLGNRILAEIGAALTKHVKEGEAAARYGEEEFALLLRASPPQALLRCEALRLEITAKRFAKTDGADLAITLSGGIAVCPGDGNDLEALLQSADQRLYDSRNAGHNQITLPTVSLQRSPPR
jgi:diguanylate cyclase (GGDEF)-like protein